LLELTAPSYAIYGGLGTQFLKTDGSTDSTSYATLGDITGTAGTTDLNLVVVEISQITEIMVLFRWKWWLYR
jgi:hypothetical protein